MSHEVAKLKVTRRMGELIVLPRVLQVGEKTDGSVTVAVTVSPRPSLATLSTVGGAGLEPAHRCDR